VKSENFFNLYIYFLIKVTKNIYIDESLVFQSFQA
jgi:hypothetical protein